MEPRKKFKAKKIQNELTLNEKVKVLEEIEANVKYEKIAEDHNTSKAAISRIKNNKENILKEWNENFDKNRKRKRYKNENEELNCKVYDFFTMCKGKNLIWYLGNKSFNRVA